MRRFLALCLVLLLSASTAWSQRDLQSILEDLAINGPEKATVEELEAFIDSNPRAELLDEGLLKLARALSQRKDYVRSAQAYRRLLNEFPQSGFRHLALYELGYVNFRAGKISEAKSSLDLLVADRDATEALRGRATRLLSDIGAQSAVVGEDAPAIGALLPMRGSYAHFGEDALAGILLAAGVFGDRPGASVEIIVKNVGSDPAAAEGAIAELAANRRVVGLIGPLLSSTALEAARSAQRNNVPIISLSQREGVTEAGPMVFRNYLSPSSQASALARLAVKKLEKKRIAVLHPQTNYGVELAKLFEREVKKLGASVVRMSSYRPGTTDFSAEMRGVFGIQVKERVEGRRKIKEYIPTAKIDALFIPDTFESVALILPYLDFYNITGVQLLGSNGWNSPKLASTAGKNAEGAYFVDGFFAESQRQGTADFVERFRSVYGRTPGIIEAQAYDAALSLISAVRKNGSGRGAVLEALGGARVTGSSGSVSFGRDREALKDLFILTVRDGRVVEAE